ALLRHFADRVASAQMLGRGLDSGQGIRCKHALEEWIMPGPLDDSLPAQTASHGLAPERAVLSRRRRVVQRIAGVVLGGVILWLLTPYPRGMLMAYVDHIRGHREVRVCGTTYPWDPEYWQLAYDRYRVYFNHVASGTPSPWEHYYSEGYNSVSWPFIAKQYGYDGFQECRHLAERRWMEAHRKRARG